MTESMRKIAFVLVAALAGGAFACSSSNGAGAGPGGTEDGGGQDAAQGAEDASTGNDATLTQPSPDGSTPSGNDSAAPSNDSGSPGQDSGASQDSAAPADAGRDVNVPADSAAPVDSGSISDDSGPGVDAADAAPACITPPPALHVITPGAGPYCPFALDGGGAGVTCGGGQDCCEPEGIGTFSECASDCTSYLTDGGTSWQCQGAGNCGAGQVCCANVGSVQSDAGCGYEIFHDLASTVCAASCTGAQVQICETTTECASGVCNVAEARGADLGVCQ